MPDVGWNTAAIRMCSSSIDSQRIEEKSIRKFLGPDHPIGRDQGKGQIAGFSPVMEFKLVQG